MAGVGAVNNNVNTTVNTTTTNTKDKDKDKVDLTKKYEPASAASRATAKGTKIVKDSSEMDKNAFLRILTAELSNQDPSNTKDSTQYVAQMAQFASLEQMANLNSTMSMSGATGLIGKKVTLNTADDTGVQYNGTVKSIAKTSSGINVNVEITKNGKTEIKEFDYKEVYKVQD